MMDWLQYVIQLKPKSSIRNREEYQLMQCELAARQTNGRFYHHLLAALGHHLADWGEWLLEQYDSSRRMTFDLSTLDGVPYEEQQAEV
jgi:hypothetical protein